MTTNDSFHVQQFNLASLAQYSYYIESKGDAVIIDPIRDITEYLEVLTSRKAKLKYILLTHFHADFVAGHLELAAKTGATIVFGPTATADCKFHEAKDNELIKLGEIELKVLHTPGHTPESSCFLLLTKEGKPHSIYTGDTLFLGDVGRPDLATSDAKKVTKEDLAGMLFESLKKLKVLPDDVVVFPGHGAGSPCGKSLSSAASCIIGNQKKNNYAVVIENKDEFVKSLLHNLPEPPQYFFFDAKLNKSNKILDFNIAVEKNNNNLKLDDFIKRQSKPGSLILDTRDQQTVLEKGLLPNSFNISHLTQFEIWVGTLISPIMRLFLVNSPEKNKEIIKKLAYIGYDNVEGSLDGGFDAWQSSKLGFGTVKLKSVTHEKVPEYLFKTENIILDVREQHEQELTGVLPNSMFIPIRSLERTLKSVPKDKQIFTLCRSGVRSQMAATILLKNGFKNVTNLEGGIMKLIEKSVKLIPK